MLNYVLSNVVIHFDHCTSYYNVSVVGSYSWWLLTVQSPVSGVFHLLLVTSTGLVWGPSPWHHPSQQLTELGIVIIFHSQLLWSVTALRSASSRGLVHWSSLPRTIKGTKLSSLINQKKKKTGVQAEEKFSWTVFRSFTSSRLYFQFKHGDTKYPVFRPPERFH